jgi:hypothetical protein
MTSFMNTSRPWDMGWWPRFALLTPEEERPAYQTAAWRTAPEEIRGELERLYTRLPAPSWPSPPESLCVNLAEGTFADWERYARAVSFDLVGPALPEQLAGTYGRLPTQVLKVATLLAALDWDEEHRVPCIGRHHLARAILICEEWRESAHRVIGRIGQTAEERLEQRVLAIVQSSYPHGVSFQEIRRRVAGTASGDLRSALRQLDEGGLVECVRDRAESGRGRPRERFLPAVAEEGER